ncbi:disease resistance protein RUN1-like isoform X2 [Eucalyptus grandis]|uniref:disease resistance protein RUN1-like isoform X2 n=1 Tax=Eucalyptus grandis TaxID=71139 RepID=UPI00192EC43B|nr:disease resistance protein RUN1-like isoform X2 [Eucalyptus grandis]
MHHPIFGHSFAVLVAPVLLFVLAFYFLNKKRTSARRNAEDVDTSASGSMAAPTEANSDGSSLSPTKANNGVSSSLTGNCYEVFLSFRGPDTRHGFTSHLYKGLVDAGIYAFKDNDELREGENIRPELLAAIRNSKILIPILSMTYGTSSWCLDELVQIMDCKNNKGQILLPIFFNVKPAEVRYQTGRFGEAFHKRLSRLRKRSSFDLATTLEKWKKALDEVSTLKGYETQGSEAELVKSIVQKVLNELKKKFGLVNPKNLIGIDVHVKKVMEFVHNKSHDTLFVGIHGMGGIGKTMLAKAIYNKLFDQFEHHSFIDDIRESCKHNRVHYLQNRLIYDILKQKIEVVTKDEGIELISSRFKRKKVLVLLDDVDDVNQVKCLAGNHDWFSSGSRIIITSRNKGVLEEAKVDYNYEHEVLDGNQSLILFSKHAFRNDSPLKEFEDLAHEVVYITKGLPLSLEVLGSLLCGRKLPFWRGTVGKLKEVPPPKVQEKLRISIEALDYKQKQIFLDIACFFIGTNKNITSYMWDACGFFPEEGIEVLIFMSLIKVGDDNKLIMHDQLRDLGREIVREEDHREPCCRSRLWDYDEAQKVLKENKGTDKIEAINLSEGSAEGFNEIFPLEKNEGDGDIYTEKQFKNLTKLRYLHMINVHLSGNFKDLMKRLKWLQWRKCPPSFEVSTFDVKELVVLELQGSKINEKWEGWSFFKMADKLKYLDLSYCESFEDADFLLAFKKLEVLILYKCERLKQINASIGDMEALLHLDLGECYSLMELPAEIGKLKALQQLYVNHTALSTLPDSIGSLKNLEFLTVNNTSIEELPNSIGSLRKLRELRASVCPNLKRILAETMCNLSSLRRLYFNSCKRLQSLPDLPFGLTHLHVPYGSCKLTSFSHLTHLKELRVWDDKDFYKRELQSAQLKSSECSQPTNVEESKSSQSLNTPFKLELLEVKDCRSIETLDVSQSIHLRTLDVRGCHNLLEVQGLDKSIYLEKLHVANCNKLVEIQDLDRLENLESLDILRCTSMERLALPKSGRLKNLNAQECKNLAEIQGLDRSEYLESLDIKGWTSIEKLYLPKSGRLKKLSACKNLAEIQGLDGLENLESLDISGCTSMERLSLPKFKSLEILQARDCANLIEIQGLDGLENLESLDISGCTSMERLSLPKFKSLKILQARNCANLVEIQGLDGLKYLKSLDISGCTSMERISLPKSKSLKILQVRDCANLIEIQGLDGLEYLVSLHIEGCTSMEMLSLPKSGRLKKLNACKNLAEIQGLDRLENLESLVISGCTSTERLSLPKSKSLEILQARDCTNLVEIQGLNGLENLESLNIFGCTSMEKLSLPKFKSLKILQAINCANLVEIQGLDGLEYLKRLDISRCTSVERISLPKSKSLKKLDARDCANLVEIQGLDGLEYLESLNISRCTSMERLSLPESKSLKILQARYCANLVEIQGLNGLEYLEYLHIYGCTSMERLSLPKSRRLKELNACENLVEIQGLDGLENLERLNISGCSSMERISFQNLRV